MRSEQPLNRASKLAPTLLSPAGVTRAFHVGGVAQQGQHPRLANLAQPGQVHHPALDGGGVDLEVAGVDHRPHGALDRKADRVRDGMVGVDELHGELARLYRLAGLTGNHLRFVQQMGLFQLEPYEPRRHPGGVDGGVNVPEHIGQRADVVLVHVGRKMPRSRSWFLMR